MFFSDLFVIQGLLYFAQMSCQLSFTQGYPRCKKGHFVLQKGGENGMSPGRALLYHRLNGNMAINVARPQKLTQLSFAPVAQRIE